jgi:hypothetical protein
VYDVNHDIGDTDQHRFMVKPYHEKIVPRARSWMHVPIQGWAEMTNQALYHAGQIGHLHQKVHVAEVPMPAAGAAAPKKRRPTLAQYRKTPDEKISWDMLMAGKVKGDEGWVPHKTFAEFMNEWEQPAATPAPEPEPTKAPALVIHMQPDVSTVKWMRDFDPEERAGVKQIGLMDFLTNNLDRHQDNLLWDNANNKFLAIDHSRSFQYKGADKGMGLTPREKHERATTDQSDRISHYIGGYSAIRRVDPRPPAHIDPSKIENDRWNQEWDDTLQWWKKTSPSIRKTMDERLLMIKDKNVRDHIKRNFDVRAAHLDDLAHHGVGNFGQLDWDRTPVPIFRYK